MRQTFSSFLLFFLTILPKQSRQDVPPFLLLTTPVPQISAAYSPIMDVTDCRISTVDKIPMYSSWPSHLISPTDDTMEMIRLGKLSSNLSINYAYLSSSPLPEEPIECTSHGQLRKGSCTTYSSCVDVMGGVVNLASECPKSMFCCMLPTCKLKIGSLTKDGHCRPRRTCPGIFDTAAGVSEGCPNPNDSPCCVAEETSVECPKQFEQYAFALVKSMELLNSSTTPSPQRMLAWAPFLLSVYDEAIGTCEFDCHKYSFLHFVMNVISENFMFSSGKSGFYKKFVDWMGVSKKLLPEKDYFSFYSPYVFSHVIGKMFKNFELNRKFGDRSLLSALRIFKKLTKEVQLPNESPPDYTKLMTGVSWRSAKYFASYLNCKTAIMDGHECGNGQGLCFAKRIPSMMNEAEYESYCVGLLPMKYGDCSSYSLDTVCCLKPYPALKFGGHLVKNEYRDIVVAIEQNIYQDASLISDLTATLTTASQAIYKATRGRAYFRSVTIVSTWNSTNGDATYETFQNADFKVTNDAADYEHPSAVSLGVCGERGQGVYLAQSHLHEEGADKLLAKMFAINQWGIGDEVADNPSNYGYVPNELNAGAPTFKAQSSCTKLSNVKYKLLSESSKKFEVVNLPSGNIASRASFAFRPDLFGEENAEFCVDTTRSNCDPTRRHNSEPNTPHNRICNRTSTLTSILRSPDFVMTQNTPRFVGNTAPTFRFVKYPQIDQQVIVIVADFSGSIPPKTSAVIINALASFLQVFPDEVKIAVAAVGPNKKSRVMFPPISPVEAASNRDKLVELVKSWMRIMLVNVGTRNSSIVSGIEKVVDRYLPHRQYRLKILVLSDFIAPAPSDNMLLAKIQQGGYSIWPVSVYSVNKVKLLKNSILDFPLIGYAQMLANSTSARWQFVVNPDDMYHWFYAFATFLSDANFGKSTFIKTFNVKSNDNFGFDYTVPAGFSLNTSIVVSYDINMMPAAVTADTSGNLHCFNDYRGYQKHVRLICRGGNTAPGNYRLDLKFGQKRPGSYSLAVWVSSRAIEHGSYSEAALNQIDLANVDKPWLYRSATQLNGYVQTDFRITPGVQVVFEHSPQFRYPTVYAVVSSGLNAILNCLVEYDLYHADVNVTNQPVTNVRMYDDGEGGDGFANDGVYSAYLREATRPGTYTVYVRVLNNNCYKKPGAARVGSANNQDLIAATEAVSFSVFSYSSAGSFVVTVPNDESRQVFKLGMVHLKLCSARDVDWSRRTLPKSMRIFCTVKVLENSKRYNFPVTYHLSISHRISEFADNDRYPSNATVRPNQSSDVEFEISTHLLNVVSPFYYAVVWAHDDNNNYATRSQILVVKVKDGQISASDNGLFPSDDDNLPEQGIPIAIIVSCAAGAGLAMALIVTLIVVLRKRDRRSQWAYDNHGVFMPPPPARQGRVPRYNYHPTYNFRPGNHRHHISGVDNSRSLPPRIVKQQRRANNTFNRQNTTNAELQECYTRATDGAKQFHF